MGRSCSIGWCTNNMSSEASLFRFPSDKVLRQLWSEVVKSTRADWDGPKMYSFICSDHFDEDSYLYGSERHHHPRLQFGYRRRPRLKPNAVPTLSLCTSNRGSTSILRDCFNNTSTNLSTDEQEIPSTNAPSFEASGIYPVACFQASTAFAQEQPRGNLIPSGNSEEGGGQKETVPSTVNSATTQRCKLTCDTHTQTEAIQIKCKIETRSVSCQTENEHNSTSHQAKVETLTTRSKGLQGTCRPQASEQSMQWQIHNLPAPTLTHSCTCKCSSTMKSEVDAEMFKVEPEEHENLSR
ncbi:uncharacterized protein [Ptychodera flava]|uniref:uncharacterized protein n=1 Tax=Ptychodera flava TaxID=63121 RepID=UPI003969C650